MNQTGRGGQVVGEDGVGKDFGDGPESVYVGGGGGNVFKAK